MSESIRDDRKAKAGMPERPSYAARCMAREIDWPDAVLYDCPDCGRSHFVRVGECPSQSEAAAETARADRKAA